MKTQEECQEVLRFATQAELAGVAMFELDDFVDPLTGTVISPSEHGLNMAVLFGIRSVLEWIVSEGETSFGELVMQWRADEALERAEDGKGGEAA